MYKRSLQFLLILFILNTYYLIHTTRASASDFSLGVYPPILQITATPPTVFTHDITVVNASDNPENVKIIFRLFTTSQLHMGQVIYLPASQKPFPDAGIFQKMQILDNANPVSNIILEPKAKRTLTLRVGLPKNEQAGDYYFSVIFMSEGIPNGGVNGSSITAGIASNILLSIGPQDADSGFLEAFSSPWFVQKGPIPFTVLLNNTSNHFITPRGQILIYNMFGQLVGNVPLLQANILAQTSRFLPAVWGEKVLFGPYSAQLIVSLSATGPVFSRTLYFFAMPWEYILGFFITVMLVGIVIHRVRQRAKEDYS